MQSQKYEKPRGMHKQKVQDPTQGMVNMGRTLKTKANGHYYMPN